MAEPVDNNNTPRIPGLNLVRDASSAAAPTTSEGQRISRRSDRIQKLLGTILMTFRFNFESLPVEAQQAYSRFQQNQSFIEFAATLKRLLLEGRLSTFMKGSPAFLHAAIDLFASRYPQLGLRELLDEVEGRTKTVPSRPRSPGQFPKSPRRAKKEALRKTEDQQAGEPSAGLSNAALARTLTLSTRSRQRNAGQQQVISWARLEPRPFAQPPQETAGVSTVLPPINVEPTKPREQQEDQPATTERPVIPGFTISTRSSTGAPGTEQSRRAQNEAWLKNYIKSRGGLKLDFHRYPYKGWKIEQPRIILQRAKNFLADEDTDRTLNWGEKFAELTEYFSYLLYNWQGEDWGAELHEVIDMLHTHWIFEQYHYGTAKLNLKFNDVWPKQNKRRASIPSAEYPIDGSGDDDMSERTLLLNPIQPAIDVHYKLPENILKKYVSVYASEVPYFWSFAPDPHSPPRELVKVENNAFEKSLFSGMEATDKNIKKAESDFKREGDKEHFSTNAFNAFATLRGTQRAALQHTLRFMDNAENLEVCNVFRTLVLPPPKIPEKPDAGIILPAMQVAEVPKEESCDPFGFTLALKSFTDWERYWANLVREHSVKECHGHKLWLERKAPIMDLPHNWRGPINHDYLDHEMKKSLALLRRCQTLRERISLQKERNRRPFLSNVFHFLFEGVSGKRWDETEIDFRGEDFMPGSEELAHIRPKEEDFLRLLGEYSIDSSTIHHSTRAEYMGPRSKIFEQRVMRIVYGEGITDVPVYSFDDFLKELNRDCYGPVKRWRFSRDEAEYELDLLEKKNIIELDEDGSVSRARADVHPEHRVRWLDTDQDLDSFLRGLGLGGEETSSNDKANKDVESDVDTMSTKISIPDSNDFGDYMFGLPNIDKLRTWEEVVDSDKKAVKEDLPRTQQLFRRLCFRLGKTIHDLREKREVYRRQLTRDQRERNRQFVHEVTRLWHLDAEHKALVTSKDPPLKEEDIVILATQEKFAPEKYGKGDYMDVIREGIIREAYENKSMLFPNRIYRHVDDKGKMIEAPRRREPVWSFAHPERKGKAPRYWDINRWPIHLQSEKTAANIRSSGPQDPPTPKRRSTKEPEVPFSPFSPLEPQPQPQGEQEAQSKAKAPSPFVTEEMDTEVDASESKLHTIPGLGEKFAVTFDDLADSRRTFTPGPPQYFLGDTPLQKQAIENFVKSGIESAEPRTWRQRFGGLFGRKEIPDDPTALPKVDPRNIPKSRPRTESSEESEDESSEEDMPGADDDDEDDDRDVEMEEIEAQLYNESEAGPSSASLFTRAEAPSPMVPAFPTGTGPGSDSLRVPRTSAEEAGDEEASAMTMRAVEEPGPRRSRPRRPSMETKKTKPKAPGQFDQEEDAAPRRAPRGTE
ncbi:hypothetical protein ACHAQI_000285 [Fusarium lateritium]